MKKHLSSTYFFYAVLLVFVLASAWVATASFYPMAFDEGFHLGLIQIYSQYLNPYAIETTRDMAQYGLIAADPSYLFHYLMSFPYRFIQLFTSSEQLTIVLLRYLNIALVVWALFIYRKLLLTVGLSRSMTHAVLALFSLIPILPLLAGQINYDNLLLVIIGWSLLLAVRIDQALRKDKSLPLADLCWLMILIVFGSTVKYAFVPIGLLLFAWVTLHTLYRYKGAFSRLTVNAKKAWRQIAWPVRVAMFALLTIGILLAGRYVGNVAEYGKVIPRCEQVFDYQACQAYGPWSRNELLHAELDSSLELNSLPEYIAIKWVPGMTKRLFFAIAGPTHDYANSPPLVLPIVVYVALFVAGLVAFSLRAKQVLQKYPPFWLLGAVVLAYLTSLIAKLYAAYEYTGIAVAINGRYLLPFLPIVGALLVVSIAMFARSYSWARFVMPGGLIVLIVLLSQGAGIGTYVLQAEPSWFWPGWGQATHAILQDIMNIVIVSSR